MYFRFAITVLSMLISSPILGAPEPDAKLDAKKVAKPIAADLMQGKPQAAIDKGLAFLLTQQKEDGSIGDAKTAARVGSTALGVITWLSSNAPEKFNGATDKAIAYLIAQQDVSGYINAPDSKHGHMYSHGYATLALAKAHLRKPDRKVMSSLERAVKLLTASQNKLGGWRYRPNDRDADAPIVACQLNALAAASAAGVEIDQKVFVRATDYLLKCQNDDGGFQYMAHPSNSNAARTAAALSALYASRRVGESTNKGHRYLLAQEINGAMPFFAYTQYYFACVLSEADVKLFNGWYRNASPALVKSQQANGSWNGKEGHIASTAMAVMALQSPNGRVRVAKRAVDANQ